MSKDRPQNVAASVRQKLLNLAKQEGEDFNFLLIRYALERLLYRLSVSSHQDRFVLKGATLFQVWSGHVHRPTRDLDLLGHGTPAPSAFENVFRDLCKQPVVDDGIRFKEDTVRAEQIKEEEEYQGLRIRLDANLATARIPVQVDIGFGDVITPGPEIINYPTLLQFPPPAVSAYPRETVIAEKYQAMVTLGIANSRMKDFFDIYTIAEQFDFSGLVLCQAIQATFMRRQTPLPQQAPLALTAEFTEDSQKLTQWNAFVAKNKLEHQHFTLPEVGEMLSRFLLQPTNALVAGTTFDKAWLAGQGDWV
jgi:predicted nucleotidyltransferase component of viral defense system